MATATTTTPWTNSSAANFRAWGSWISGFFATAGWVNVFSAFATGTNWTDVSAPTATSDMEVAEIWRMADAHQAAAPLFLKIEYGAGTAAINNPGVRLTIGTGHDGSGNITGVLFSGSILNCTANANNMTHYASGSTDRISFAMAMSGTGWANTQEMVISIERRIDSTGAPLATGFLYATCGGTTRISNACLASAAGPASQGVWAVPAIFTAEANMTFDAKQAVAPVAYCLGPAEVGLNLVGVPATAYSVGGTFTVSLFGSNHTYVVLESTAHVAAMNVAVSSPSLRPAMRYE